MIARPQPIIDFYERCLSVANGGGHRVRLRQTGELRLGPSKPWMPFTAVQTMSSQQIEFRWRANFKMAGVIPGVVVDCFEQGQGRLDAWLFHFLRVAHARGPKVDRSEVQRYLAEVVWCPMAILENEALQFQTLSNTRVRISAYDDDTYVDWIFNDDSDVIGVKTSTRYRDEETQPWEGRFADYKDFGGLRIPSFGEVWWDTPHGRFVYWRGTVTDFALV